MPWRTGALGTGVSPWGAGITTPGVTPWGAGITAPGVSPFGVAPGVSPWGAGKAPGVSPYGVAPGVSPWGTGKAPGVSPYGFAPGVSPWGAGKAPGVSPWGVGKAAPAAVAPACATMMGPVANVCQQATAVTTVTPSTTVTPIPTMIAPQMYQGAPVVADVQTYPLPAAATPWGKAAPTAVPGVGAFGQVVSPWGAAIQATTGAIPGIYTTDVALPGIF